MAVWLGAMYGKIRQPSGRTTMTWLDVVYNNTNSIIVYDVTDTSLIVSLADARVIQMPIQWFPVLEKATPQQRQEFTLNEWGVD
jgi:hypothetical protein